MAAQTTDAWAETRKIHREFSSFYKIAGGLLLVLIGILIGAGLFHNDEGYWGNILSEVLGIGFAVFVLDQRAEQRRIKDLQERLVMEAGSQSNETAKQAIYELERRGWLKSENGLLNGAELWESNLQGAQLVRASLQGSQLWRANLQDAQLWRANLQKADLGGAKLQKANLWLVNLKEADLRIARLQGANLRVANLRGAILRNAKLQGTNLLGADLQGADLEGAEFDENTLLPDGNKWTPDVDLTRFTDPNHAQFWRSDNPNSPAFRGKQSPNTE